MRRVLTVAAAAVALALSGCGGDASQTPPALTPLETGASAPVAPPPDQGPLPPPQALSGVITRLADPAVPGPDKLGLVENTTPPDAAALDAFAAALRDTGFTPVTVRASDIRWLASRPGAVVATVTVSGPDSGPDAATAGDFVFPMEFRRFGDGWQLTRETADMLLAFGNARTAASGPR